MILSTFFSVLSCPFLAREIWWFCTEFIYIYKPECFCNLNVKLNIWKTLLNCKHIENTNTSFCIHNRVIENAISWPSLLWIHIHTTLSSFEWDRVRHQKYYLTWSLLSEQTHSKQYIIGFLFELIFNYGRYICVCI